MYKKLYYATAFWILAAAPPLRSQDIWNLERCIRYAQDNNIAIQQSKSAVRTALLTERQSRAARLPNITANVNAGEQYGRTIDPTTNQFLTTGIGFNRLSLNAGVSVFSGGLINHQVKLAKWDAQAALADLENAANNLGLQVAQAYLSILLSEEQTASARRRAEQSRRQLDATLKLINAGNIPQADRFNLEAQIARDEQTIVVAQNSVDLAYLNLKQLLQLEPDFNLQIEKPAVSIPADVNPEIYTLPEVYGVALGTQPGVRAADLRVKSAEEGVAISKASYYPTLTLFANLTSNYSTQFKRPLFTGNTVPGTTVTVDIAGQQVPVTFLEPEFTLERVPYFTQMDQNFGQGVGVNLSVPIYQNGQTRLQVERARLGVVNAQLQQVQTRQQLKNDIQTAIANARAGRKQLDAAQRTYEATKIAFENTQKRQQLGAVNTLELTTAQTNLNIAENELIIARYDYLFRLKILDFYEGKPLKLGN